MATNEGTAVGKSAESGGGSEDKAREKLKVKREEMYSLKVKPQFVLKERSPVLAALPVESCDGSGSARAGDHADRDGKHMFSNRAKKKKNRGMNKKRPRDARTANADKMCLAVLQGEDCPFGAEKCRYSHDVKAALADRQPDIAEVEEGCPRFNLCGFCEFGIMCRVGSAHINMSTGQNLRKEIEGTEGSQKKEVMNVLDKGVQTQLRKKTYPFVCKRHSEEKNGGKGGKDKQWKDEGNVADADKNGKTASDLQPKQKSIEGMVDSKGQYEGEECKPEANEPPKDESETLTNELTPTTSTSPPFEAMDLSPLPTKRKLIDFRNKVYVAPLTTVGNLPFRRIMKKFGADITCGEMAVATNLLDGRASEWALLKRHPDEDVFGIQIAGGFPDQCTRISEVLEKEVQMDFLDLNLGCPIDLICSKGAGASLMLRDKKLKQCLEGISKTLSCPLTVKMRTGWDEEKPFAHSLVPKIQSWQIDGLSAIMIHGRSRLQRYSREADWDYIQKVANSQVDELPKIPIIGNGDVFSYRDYGEKVAREGIEATAMLARGALIKPWLPTEIKDRRDWDISSSERLDMLKEFVRFGLEHWGSDQQGVNTTRRFLLEWLSFLYRYVPVGLLERLPQEMNQRPPNHMCGRNDLETLMLSRHCVDWIKISEMLLGPVPEGFRFEPKHKANAYKTQ